MAQCELATGEPTEDLTPGAAAQPGVDAAWLIGGKEGVADGEQVRGARAVWCCDERVELLGR